MTTALGQVVVAECVAIARAVGALDETTFAHESNCPPWSLKELIVHIWQTLHLPASFPPSDAEPVRAADWY